MAKASQLQGESPQIRGSRDREGHRAVTREVGLGNSRIYMTIEKGNGKLVSRAPLVTAAERWNPA